jgi:DNA mismatch endonuclease (patch repair protein)
MDRPIGRAGLRMADVFTKKKRSEVMSHIRSRGTVPEILFKRFLDQVGASYVYQPSIFGKPDFLLKGDIVVFIDNRFWHGKSNLPKQNRKYWLTKLERNRKRDVEVNRQLRKDGYRVVRIEDKVVLKMLKDLNGKGGR